MSDKKRAFDGPQDGNAVKKLRPAPSDIVAQKRAEIAAKLAAMRGGSAGSGPGATPSKPAVAPPPATPPAAQADLARRVAEARRRVAEAQTKLSVKDNPYMSVPQTKKRQAMPEPAPTQQGVGLKMAAHPLLLDTSTPAPQSKKDRYKPMQPKFASIKANARNAPSPTPAPVSTPVPVQSNPYLSGSSTPSAGPSQKTDPAAQKGPMFTGVPRERAGRTFRFNPKGKYVAQGNQLRQDAKLSALKERIAEGARKAGMDGDAVLGIGANVRRPAPPEAEWWDSALLPNKNYDDLDLVEGTTRYIFLSTSRLIISSGFEHLNIHNSDSPITIYVQHPIAIPAPGDKNHIALKPLMLTSREQKKMRRLRRKAELQDKRDRIKAGLLPPDAPKVRLSNLMKVLTSDAVQDPTRVEARVRREVAMRKHTHVKMNAERKLTDEQRRAKIENKKAEEEKRGVYGAVYKVKKLTDPSHQFKVRKNAEQLGLTGITIFHQAFSVVYVEGAAKYIRKYRKLMLERIAWTQAARPRGAEDVELEEGGEDEAGPSTSAGTGVDALSAAVDEQAVVASIDDNTCHIVWEGQVRERSFNNFKSKSCPTDAMAKEALGERLKGYWDMARNWKPDEEELF
ncbi:PRP3-domain-containing protein [Fistulina hepatica ATCC 64428]|uniref:PRP3-domain-containing protein n=1 Tax=Fistulina hepatica ATCC 64428 TaxID=1128425 RepID=A0A0D7A5M3_9AGAR|nr:PRP3-domain-containing protein [Fistulina hepatica ATCC 64428]